MHSEVVQIIRVIKNYSDAILRRWTQKTARICSKFQGLTQILDYNIKAVLWIFTFSTQFISSKTRNPLLTFLLSYHVWVTSKIQVNFRFERYWWYCLINCWNFQTIHVFEVRESIADISTELPCLSYLKNLGQLPVQGYLKGTDNCILWIFIISSPFMFSRSRNSLLTFLLSYDVWVISKIRVNFRFERYWWFCLMNFSNFHTIRVFEVRDSIADISTELSCSGNLENPDKLPVQDLLGGTDECVL